MRILTAIDFSPVTKRVIDYAKRFTAEKENKMWLVHVAEPQPDFVGFEAGPAVVRDQIAEEYKREHRRLQDYADELRGAGADVTALLIQGPPVRSICDQAKDLEADLIILGSHGHGAVYDLLVGSVSEGVIRKAEAPVLVVPMHANSGG